MSECSKLLAFKGSDPLKLAGGWWRQRAARSTSTRPAASGSQLQAARSYRRVFPAASDSAIMAIARRSIASSNDANRSSSSSRRRTKRRSARSSSIVTASSTRRSRSRKTDAPMRPGGVCVKRRIPQAPSRPTRTVLVNRMTVLSSACQSPAAFRATKISREIEEPEEILNRSSDGRHPEGTAAPPSGTRLPASPGRAPNGLGPASAVAWGSLPCPRSPATSRS